MKRTNGRNRIIRTPENVNRVRLDILWSLNRSVCLRPFSFGVNESTTCQILKLNLAFHRYKIQFCQQLLTRDYQQRFNFAQLMIELMDNNDSTILFMSDEAHFHLNGYVNNKSCHYWSSVNRPRLHKAPLHTSKVTVWCTMGPIQIIGSYFFENNGQMTTDSLGPRQSHQTRCTGISSK